MSNVFPSVGYLQIRVGDETILRNAYRCLSRDVDLGSGLASPRALQRFRELLAEVERLSDNAPVSDVAPISGVWSGRAV